MTDQRIDLPSRERITQLERRYTRVARLLLSLSVFTLAAAIVGIFIVNGQNGAINKERFHNVARTCSEQNARHDRTVRELDTILRSAAALHPRRAGRINESRNFTVALINTLAPRRDCEAYARKLVKQ